ncbi:hypothetical protein HPY28_07755 [Brevibacillus sp. HB1.2]|nr:MULTISPECIES: hypothetical protein [unclassified Brevibacillus]NTU20207.1 hypothetical protein [Brevibacillus sp. HB1.2]NTU29448.1 hypothetical protein [Brevibacillus sp. HB1.1]
MPWNPIGVFGGRLLLGGEDRVGPQGNEDLETPVGESNSRHACHASTVPE